MLYSMFFLKKGGGKEGGIFETRIKASIAGEVKLI